MRWLIDGFSRLGSADDLQIAGDGLLLRPALAQDFPEWSGLRARSRAFLTPWEPAWPADDLTRGAFRRRILQANTERREGTGFSFLIFRADGSELLGGITLSHIWRRAAQSGTLGYWMGEAHAGQGHMGRAVRLISGFAFHELRLERLEAACLPENAASIRVLEKAGFRREGYARAYLSIAGRRRDHLLFGLLKGDLFPPLPQSS
jgi:ribosomal-protein-alanine N-acetyltransferase